MLLRQMQFYWQSVVDSVFAHFSNRRRRRHIQRQNFHHFHNNHQVHNNLVATSNLDHLLVMRNHDDQFLLHVHTCSNRHWSDSRVHHISESRNLLLK
jgi:hypothetical protein